ncbi:hypothetical protein CKO28_02655 [Rhodovibrio sodomensis]|jgi:type IV secretory pathway VirB3-like protein|uniref:Type IV secretion system protein VirB3 n=1 Tax=Rhodovibrio sodomensis TaxID=1088 RepID=A0ABS1D954_9PROT|nr:hypothetical protein [Rhodovibrio sodomensis]MBK1666943.1 hypothetical protein [Rhodovibrio sodomensis]
MRTFKSPVLTAIAYPATLAFVPVQLVGMNISINVALMMISIVVLNLTPVIWLVSAIVGHLALMTWSFREPHLVSLGQAFGRTPGRSKNIVPSSGVKYVP